MSSRAPDLARDRTRPPPLRRHSAVPPIVTQSRPVPPPYYDPYGLSLQNYQTVWPEEPPISPDYPYGHPYALPPHQFSPLYESQPLNASNPAEYPVRSFPPNFVDLTIPLPPPFPEPLRQYRFAYYPPPDTRPTSFGQYPAENAQLGTTANPYQIPDSPLHAGLAQTVQARHSVTPAPSEHPHPDARARQRRQRPRPRRPSTTARTPSPTYYGSPPPTASQRTHDIRPPTVTHQCFACFDEQPDHKIIRLHCANQHKVCIECLNNMFSAGTRNRESFPPRCCNSPLKIAEFITLLRDEVKRRYYEVYAEYSSKEPMYCADGACSAFLAEVSADTKTAACPKCAKQTCAMCKMLMSEHREAAAGSATGVEMNKNAWQGSSNQSTTRGDTSTSNYGPTLLCPPQPRTLTQLHTLMDTRKWKACPTCRNAIERTDGCDHMECVCGTDFCYRCGKLLDGSASGCDCGRRAALMGAGAGIPLERTADVVRQQQVAHGMQLTAQWEVQVQMERVRAARRAEMLRQMDAQGQGGHGHGHGHRQQGNRPIQGQGYHPMHTHMYAPVPPIPPPPPHYYPYATPTTTTTTTNTAPRDPTHTAQRGAMAAQQAAIMRHMQAQRAAQAERVRGDVLRAHIPPQEWRGMEAYADDHRASRAAAAAAARRVQVGQRVAGRPIPAVHPAAGGGGRRSGAGGGGSTDDMSEWSF